MSLFTHFYSDPHFGHHNIVKYADRPFLDGVDMDSALIRNYRHTVGPDDYVLWCGDAFLCKPDYAASVMARLPGKKLLIRGNHDRKSRTALIRIGFEDVLSRLEFVLGNYPILAKHHPTTAPGVTVMHGHTHTRERRAPGRVHVGVDAWDYTPVSAATLLTLLKDNND